jgi:hypothetical protein
MTQVMAGLRQRFDQAWQPRLGRQAAGQLRRLAGFALGLGPVVILLSVAGSLGLSSGRLSSILLGLAAVVAVIGLCVGWVRLSMAFAASVSRWFGEEISWRELPRFRPSLFDEWCPQRGLRPAARS